MIFWRREEEKKKERKKKKKKAAAHMFHTTNSEPRSVNRRLQVPWWLLSIIRECHFPISLGIDDSLAFLKIKKEEEILRKERKEKKRKKVTFFITTLAAKISHMPHQTLGSSRSWQVRHIVVEDATNLKCSLSGGDHGISRSVKRTEVIGQDLQKLIHIGFPKSEPQPNNGDVAVSKAKKKEERKRVKKRREKNEE